MADVDRVDPVTEQGTDRRGQPLRCSHDLVDIARSADRLGQVFTRLGATKVLVDRRPLRPPSHARSEIREAFPRSQHFGRAIGRDQKTADLVARLHREGRAESRQHGEPEDLALAEVVDDPLVVVQIHDAIAEHEQLGGWVRALSQDRGSWGIRSRPNVASDVGDHRSRQIGERWDPSEELGHFPWGVGHPSHRSDSARRNAPDKPAGRPIETPHAAQPPMRVGPRHDIPHRV